MTGADRVAILRTGWPQALHAVPMYLPYRLCARSTGRMGKVPVRQGGTNWYPVDPTDRRFHLTYEAALRHVEDGAVDGAGVVLSPHRPVIGGLPLVALDLDDCLHQGQVKEARCELVAEFDTYTEVSCSGGGLHLVAAGCVPTNRRGNGVEVIANGFLALTGARMAGTTPQIQARPRELHDLVAALTVRPPARSSSPPGSLDGAEVLHRLRSGPSAEKFAALYERGDLGRYGGDHSRADAALLGLLAYHTSDPSLIADLFSRSALFRPARWRARASGDGQTYGEVSVAYVLTHKGNH